MQWCFIVNKEVLIQYLKSNRETISDDLKLIFYHNHIIYFFDFQSYLAVSINTDPESFNRVAIFQ